MNAMLIRLNVKTYVFDIHSCACTNYMHKLFAPRENDLNQIILGKKLHKELDFTK